MEVSDKSRAVSLGNKISDAQMFCLMLAYKKGQRCCRKECSLGNVNLTKFPDQNVVMLRINPNPNYSVKKDSHL